MKADSLSFLTLITKLQGHSVLFKNTLAVVQEEQELNATQFDHHSCSNFGGLQT